MEATPPTAEKLKQFKIDGNAGQHSPQFEIEVSFEPVPHFDPENLCCQLLLNRYRKQPSFFTWKNKFLEREQPNLEIDELRGINLQTDRNASYEIKKMRQQFLFQFGKLAIRSLNRLKLSRLFSRWLHRYDTIRVLRTQKATSLPIYHRKLKENSLHQMDIT